MHETLAHLFDQTALRLGEKKAILFLRKGRLESQMTYSSLQQISNRVANGLKERGLRKGERVILFMPKSIEQMLFHLGVQKVGAISVILNPGFKKDEMGYFLRDTEFSLERGNSNDPAIFIYTSGTTGQPKGAILTQQNLSQDAKNIIRIWEITEKDVLCHALPLFHVHG